MAFSKGNRPHNKQNRTGKKYGKLTVRISEGNGRWLCVCECGNKVSVLSTNLANYAKNNRGCKHCANRVDIRGETVGLLTAVCPEPEVVSGRHPLWTFVCECGNTIQATVIEFHAGWVRSCGCMDNAVTSWGCMMSRCYDESNNRYQYYGGRGIKVCERWHDLGSFLADMGERPKRHTLSRKRCEEDYGPDNCIWEHISKNTADTYFGKPTSPGLKKGAKPR